jgi:hypothetical protein
MINRKVLEPSNNLTMEPEARPSIYTGFRTPPIMRGGDRATVEAFEQAVAAIHVRQAQRLFGEPGYLTFAVPLTLRLCPLQEPQAPRECLPKWHSGTLGGDCAEKLSTLAARRFRGTSSAATVNAAWNLSIFLEPVTGTAQTPLCRVVMCW